MRQPREKQWQAESGATFTGAVRFLFDVLALSHAFVSVRRAVNATNWLVHFITKAFVFGRV